MDVRSVGRLPATVVVLVAMMAAGCDGGDGGVSFEVVADSAQPAIARGVPTPEDDFSQGPVMPGVEVAVTGIARNANEVAGLWQQAGFDGSPPQLGDNEALLVLAGGEASACPWQVQRVLTGKPNTAEGEVSLQLGTDGDQLSCGGPWQPRAVALTLSADVLPDEPHIEIGAVERPVPFPRPLIRLTADGPRVFQRQDATYQLTPPDEDSPAPPAQLATSHPMAVTSFPGFDVIQLRLDWHQQDAHLTANYVTEPDLDIPGDAFLKLHLANTTAGPDTSDGPDAADGPDTPTPTHPSPPDAHLQAAPQAAITKIVRVPADDSLTWIVGIDGGKARLTHWSDDHDGPTFTGWTHVIGLRHPR